MKKIYILPLLLFGMFVSIFAQTGNVGIGTNSPDNSSILDITSSDKGLLIPRISIGNVSTFGLSGGTSTAGMVVYNTNASITGGYGIGFYYWSGSAWTKIATGNPVQATLSNGRVWIGNASNVPTEQTISGDATISNTGVLDLSNGAVETSEIADNAVTTAKINDGAVTTPKIADNAVTTVKINDAAVTTAKINDGAVTTPKIADNAVTTIKINDAAVTTVKINDNAVTTPKIADNAVTTVKINDAAVTTAKIANNAVDGTKINLTGNANGDLMYYNGTDWVRLASGTSGQILRTNGAAAPTWSDPTALFTFQNGLTETAPNIVELGGALIKPTTISGLTATNKMSFTGTGVDAFNVDVATFSVDASNNRVGIGTAAPTYQLTLGGTGNVFGVENTASFAAKNNGGGYETYFWPRWSDNIMYMNYGSGGFNLRNVSSATAMFIDNDLSIDIRRGVLFNCNDCGATNTIDGTGNWGDLVIQGRVLSTNSNLHLSPPGGYRVVINSSYRSAGGSTGTTGLDIEDGGIRMRKTYLYYQDYGYTTSGNGWDNYKNPSLGAWDFCAVGQFGFKNNGSDVDEDDDAQCAVYPTYSGFSSGPGEQTYYNSTMTRQYYERPTWYMYFEAYDDTNGITCAANCINFE